MEAALQAPEDVAALIAALCTEEAGKLTGQVFFVGRGEIGLFHPLAVEQRTSTEAGSSVEALLAVLGGFRPHPLEGVY
jgi:hypothetical protein